MNELSPTSPPNSPEISIVMTPAARERARREGITSIEPNHAAIERITHELGQCVLPRIMVMRSAEQERSLIGNWDVRLPRNKKSPTSDLYLTAQNINNNHIAELLTYDDLVQTARQIGAITLTEISISGFSSADEAKYPEAFATGLLLGQRPLELPEAPNIGSRLKNVFNEGFNNGALRSIAQIRTHNPPLESPFIIRRSGDQSAIGE